MTGSNNIVEPVPYIVHESALSRMERTTKRLIIALVILVVLLFTCNAAWLYAWCQYDYSSEETQTITVDGKDGIANYVGNDGDITNGESCSQNHKNTNSD
jgi:hypothetical protein